MDSGVVDIHGQEYVLIATRIARFREDHPDWSIEPQILSDGEIVKCRTEVRDQEGRLIAVGHAEEDRALGNINKTSSVENCETSSVGRALAFVSGNYAGKTIRSAEEMADAIKQQAGKAQIEYMALVREHWETIAYMKEHLAQNKIDAAREAYKELEPEHQSGLWRAPSKGGIFTTEERDKLKQPEKYREEAA